MASFIHGLLLNTHLGFLLFLFIYLKKFINFQFFEIPVLLQKRTSLGVERKVAKPEI